MSKNKLSTFDREMKDEAFQKQFEKEYAEFQLAELMIEMMEKKSVRKLGKEAGVSPTVIQNVRSGKQENLMLTNFINISHACGFHIFLEGHGKKILVGE